MLRRYVIWAAVVVGAFLVLCAWTMLWTWVLARGGVRL